MAFIRRQKGLPLIVLGLAVGLFLIFFGSHSGTKSAKDTPDVQKQAQEMQEYRKELEDRVRELLEDIPGVGNISVMVTLSSGRESVYAQDGNGTNRSYVTIRSDGEQAVFLRENEPEICGVAVVCPGADAALRLELTQLICSLFHLGSNRVYVTG